MFAKYFSQNKNLQTGLKTYRFIFYRSAFSRLGTKISFGQFPDSSNHCSSLPLGHPSDPTEELFKRISGRQTGAMVSSGYACFKIVLFLRRTYVQLKLEVLARAQGYSCFMPQTSLDYYRGAPSDHMTGVKQHNDPKKFEIDRNHCFATIL